MDFFTAKDDVLHVENVPLPVIAQDVGTPSYIYSASSIRHQFEALETTIHNALPKNERALLCYACKANSNLAILTLLRSLGSGLEIVSEGELYRGLAAGFDPKNIVATGVGKQVSEIRACLEAGILQFNVESLPELQKIGEVAKSMRLVAPVVFRLNPDVSGGGHHKISTGRKRDKFGLSAQRVFEAFEYADQHPALNALGLSVHIGSQVFEIQSFKAAFEKLPALVQDLRTAGHKVEHLDIGGGFPIRYEDEQLLDLSAYAQWVKDIIAPLGAKIIMEPGRYLVGNSGVLLTKTLYVKATSDRHFLIVDGAMNDLIRPTLYDAYHGIEAVQNRDRAPRRYDIVGPVCETGDTFALDRELPEMEANDLVVIKSAGAYGFSMASNYNSRPLPAEILVDGDRYAVIRARQSYEDLLGQDQVPDWF